MIFNLTILKRNQTLRALPFVFLWIGGFILFYRSNWAFNYETMSLRSVDPIYALSYGLPRLTIELLVLYLILRPNSFYWSWRRALLAISIFLPWTIYSIRHIMHTPEWVAMHVYWLMVLVLALIIFFFICSIGAWQNSQKK